MDAPTAAIKTDRAALQQVIAGLTDGVILVEPDQSISWANAAALAMHGLQSLDGLGGTVDGYRRSFRLRFRNNHPLPEEKYPLDRVIAGETFDDVTVEVSPAADPDTTWVHTLRSLVVVDRDGKPELLVLIVKDETERFEAEDRFESAFNANPAPALICRVADQVYVRVNQGFMDMTGHDRSAVVGRSVREFDVFTSAERRDIAHERIAEGRAVTQMEAEVPLPDGTGRAVIVAGQPIDVGGEPCILFTFADLEPRRKAETSLRKSEERFSKSFRLSPVAEAITRLDDHVFIEVNRAFEALSGYSDVELTGRAAADVRLWADPASRRTVEGTLREGRGVQNAALAMRTKDGAEVDCLLSAEAVEINEEACVLWVVQDVTERKKTEDELIAAIESVMADTSWFSRTVVEKLANLRQTSRKPGPGIGVGDLTDRERQILGLISEGCDNVAMSDRLGLSTNTVRNHVASLFRKIGVNRRAAAVVWARERGVTGETAVRGKRRPSP
jgi:PAS domain S-box-containing protein